MAFSIQNEPLLKKILWLDFALGFSCGLLGCLFSAFFSRFLELPEAVVFWISAITLGYSVGAFGLAFSKRTSPAGLFLMVAANWFWAAISLVLIYFHTENASILGKIWLWLQIVAVGGLAFLEGRHLKKMV